MLAQDPVLEAFLRAAALAPRVWAWQEAGKMRTAGQAPAAATGIDTTALLAHALREAFGRSAAEGALRQLAAAGHTDGSLPAALVRQVIESAEASRSLLQGAAFGLRVRYSAVASGAGFRACCEELGLAADALPFERRSDIDAQVARRFDDCETPSAELAAGWLREALRRPVH